MIVITVNFELRVPGTHLVLCTLSSEIDLGTRPLKVLKEALQHKCFSYLGNSCYDPLKYLSTKDFFSSEIAGLFQHPIHHARFQQNQKLSQKKQSLQEHTMMTMYLKSHLIIP